MEQFANTYLDPNRHFRPHIYFYLDAYQYFFLKSATVTLENFAKLDEFSNAWQALARLARGIIYEESLKNPRKARKEFESAITILPTSAAAEETRDRLT